MQRYLVNTVVAVALIGSVGIAAAAGDKSESKMQSQTTGQSGGSMSSGTSMKGKLSLTSLQKQQIASKLSSERASSAPASFRPSVGAKVPSSVNLKPLPTTVSADITAAKDYSYVKLRNNDIVLVDPKDRTIAAVIEGQASTTGSGSGMDKKMQR